MTLGDLQDLVARYADEHRYELAEDWMEVGSRVVADAVIVAVTTFPDHDTSGRTTATRPITLQEVAAHEGLRAGGDIYAYLSEIIDGLIADVDGRRPSKPPVEPPPVEPPVEPPVDPEVPPTKKARATR